MALGLYHNMFALVDLQGWPDETGCKHLYTCRVVWSCALVCPDVIAFKASCFPTFVGNTTAPHGAGALKQAASREILLWMTPSEASEALEASVCNELLDHVRASW